MQDADGELRNHILDSAQSLFGQLGYDGTTLEMIAQSAGVPTSVVKEHFGDRRSVYEDVFRRTQEPMDALLGLLSEESGLPIEVRVERHLNRFIDYVGGNPDLSAMWQQRRMGDAADLHEIEERYALPQFKRLAQASAEVFREDVDLALMLWTLIWTIDAFFNNLPGGVGAERSPEAVARLRRHLFSLLKPFLRDTPPS